MEYGFAFMRTWNSQRIIGGVAVAALLVGANARADIAFDTPNTTVGNQTAGPYNLGEEFKVGSQPIDITQLGAFDSGRNGFGSATITVAIYSTAGGSPLVSETFTGTQGSLAANSSYRFQTVPTTLLAANTTYMIVASGLGTALNPDYNSNGSSTLVTHYSGTALTFGLGSPNGYGNYYGTAPFLASQRSLTQIRGVRQ